jgi:hypothetical protein
MYTWPWEARPGPKFPGLGPPEHACGPGLARRFRPDGCDGPSLGLRNVPNKEEARPEAQSPMGICCDGPGLVLGFLHRAFLGPARPELCPGILSGHYVSGRWTWYLTNLYRADATDHRVSVYVALLEVENFRSKFQITDYASSRHFFSSR